MPAVAGAVLFDLDGTLTDPFVGITRSMQHALVQLGRAAPEAESLRAHIGPPLQATFPKLLASDDILLAAEALRLYRQRYADVGKFENKLIPGIPEALAQIAARGHFMAVATSKLESYAREIVEHFGMMPYFREVHGSQLDGSHADKDTLIGHIVATHGLDPDRTVMIGDRMHDVGGAAKNGIRTIGVLWGFGDRTELEAAGAAALAGSPSELAGLVARLMP
ncbi:MAG: HAD hydrolase-like protein [Rhizobiaceae bacterium]